MSKRAFIGAVHGAIFVILAAFWPAHAASETAESIMAQAQDAAQRALLAEEQAWTAAERSQSTSYRAREAAQRARDLVKSEVRSIAYDIGRYLGQVRNGEPNGVGVFYYNSGSRYEGEFVNGLFEGHGVLHFLDNDTWHGDRYEGEFRADAADGYGVYQFHPDNGDEGDRYEGELNDWAFERYGVYFYLEGDYWYGTTAAGEFADGYNEGFGVFEYAGDNAMAGDRYEGEIRDDLHNGFGTYLENNGTITFAFWRDDEPVALRSVVIAADGETVVPDTKTSGGSSSSSASGSAEVIEDVTPGKTEGDKAGDDETVVGSIDGDGLAGDSDGDDTIYGGTVFPEAESSEQILLAQGMLQNLGYDVGYADGVMGPQTHDAIVDFQDEVGLPITGTVDETLIYALRTAVSLTRRIGGLGSDQQSTSPNPGLELWATGTGFVVSSTGDMVTNHHVIEGCREVRVGDFGEAEVIAFDEDNDLALLDLTVNQPIEVVSFRSQPKVARGESIVVIGFPLHGTLSSFGNVTDGMISALSGFNDDFREYQFSAPIQPGNSGGPLLDRSGNVIGVVSSELVADAAEDVPQNVNFAIKAAIVEAFLGAYGVDFTVTPSEDSLEVEQIAADAERHTFLVECWGDPGDY